MLDGEIKTLYLEQESELEENIEKFKESGFDVVILNKTDLKTHFLDKLLNFFRNKKTYKIAVKVKLIKRKKDKILSNFNSLEKNNETLLNRKKLSSITSSENGKLEKLKNKTRQIIKFKNKYFSLKNDSPNNSNNNDIQKLHQSIAAVMEKIQVIERELQDKKLEERSKLASPNSIEELNLKLTSVINPTYSPSVEELKILKEAFKDALGENIEDKIKYLFRKSIKYCDIAQFNPPVIATFIGSTGVGKTSIIRKILTAYSSTENFNPKKFSVINLDTTRSDDTLSSSCKVLNIEHTLAFDYKEIENKIKNHIIQEKRDYVFIDTPGINTLNKSDWDYLFSIIKNLNNFNNETILCLSLTNQFTINKNTYEKTLAYNIKIDKIIFTKFDEIKNAFQIFSFYVWLNQIHKDNPTKIPPIYLISYSQTISKNSIGKFNKIFLLKSILRSSSK